jgi:hypothetical protein
LWSTEADFAFLSNRQYPFASDGGLFDNTPLSQLLNQVSVDDAPATRVIVINLFPNRGSIPKNIINVWDRMIEIQFSNKTKKDVALAQKINKLIAAIGRLQGLPVHHADSLTQLPEFADLAKYKSPSSRCAATLWIWHAVWRSGQGTPARGKRGEADKQS